MGTQVSMTEDDAATSCQTCGLRFRHWYHYYSDMYGPLLSHSCPKRSSQEPKPTGGCWYHFKFFLWLILMPVLTILAVMSSIYGAFKTFIYQPIHFEFSNMNRKQQFKWKCPIYTLYVLVSIVLVLCEVVLPILATPVCIPGGYFIHIYGYVV